MLGLEIPEVAWRSYFRDYRELVADTTEASDNFHYATFLNVLGCTLGRRLHVYHATKLYPNFYTCLVGRTGLTRKDTCANRGSDILARLNADNENLEAPPFRMVRGIRSYEGLLDELSGQRKVRLVVLGEILSLLTKARQESLSNIVPQLTELYDCPDREQGLNSILAEIERVTGGEVSWRKEHQDGSIKRAIVRLRDDIPKDALKADQVNQKYGSTPALV
jgi:hypothetical protein